MDIFYANDFFSFGFLIVILLVVGGMMIKTRPDLDHWGHRLAAGAFVGYVILGGIETNADDASHWAALTFRGLFAAGFVLGIAWIALPILGLIHQHTIRRPAERARQWRNEAERRRRDKDTRREAEKQAALRQAEWERYAPERERDRLQAEANAQTQTETQRRREDARASALLSFSFYAAKLGPRFTREMFDEYIRKYMGDEHPAELVERRGKELIAIFEKHLLDVQPAKQPTSIESLGQWYQQTKTQIEGLGLDEGVKDVRLIDLEKRFNDLLSKQLEESEP